MESISETYYESLGDVKEGGNWAVYSIRQLLCVRIRGVRIPNSQHIAITLTFQLILSVIDMTEWGSCMAQLGNLSVPATRQHDVSTRRASAHSVVRGPVVYMMKRLLLHY